MFLKKLRRNRKAITGLVIATVIGLITIAIILPVGILVTAQLNTVVNSMALTGVANTTANAVFVNVYSAFNLATIIPIVAAAGAIITIIVGVMAFRSSRDQQ